MGMYGTLRRVTPAQLTALYAEPDTITGFLFGKFEDAEVDPADVYELDKAWHGLHYLLTGAAWEGKAPLNFINAGTQIGEDDVGDWLAKGFTAAEVAAISAGAHAHRRGRARSAGSSPPR